MSIADELEKLKKLHESGALSAKEFEEAKRAALGKSNNSQKPPKKEPKQYGCLSTGCLGIIMIWFVAQVGTCSSPEKIEADREKIEAEQAELSEQLAKLQGKASKTKENVQQKQKSLGKITTSKVDPALLYKSPHSNCVDEVENDSRVLAKIPENTTLHFEALKREPIIPGANAKIKWFKVTFNDQTGWICELSTQPKKKSQ